jgi:nitroreductase
MENFIPYINEEVSDQEMMARAEEFRQQMSTRRSIRNFSDRPVDDKVIEHIIMAASSAPSGANKQPWTFCMVSDPKIKGQIRQAAEKEEYENYHGRMGDEWLEDLKIFGTDWKKPFLEIAPWLIVIFKKSYDLDVDGVKTKNYYVQESVGIAAGMLITAIHHAGLVTLTHTPSPMNFLEKILNRPPNEKAYLLLPVGFAAKDAEVPNIEKKGIHEVGVRYGV